MPSVSIAAPLLFIQIFCMVIVVIVKNQFNMKKNNGYISLNQAAALVSHGAKFKQDLSPNGGENWRVEKYGLVYKLNRKTATELKNIIFAQTKIF